MIFPDDLAELTDLNESSLRSRRTRLVGGRKKDGPHWVLRFRRLATGVLGSCRIHLGGFLQELEFPEFGYRVSRVIPTVRGARLE